MPLIDCDFTDPVNTSITTGTLNIVAAKTTPPLLKHTSVEVVPGDDVDLLAGTYKVYYTPSDTSKNKYVGEIIVGTSPTTLVDLLSAQ